MLKSNVVQSTLATELSRALCLPIIRLDEILWKPNRAWELVSDEEFDAELRRQLENYKLSGWVMDGNYRRLTGQLTQDLATSIICKYVFLFRAHFIDVRLRARSPLPLVFLPSGCPYSATHPLSRPADPSRMPRNVETRILLLGQYSALWHPKALGCQEDLGGYDAEGRRRRERR